MFPGSLGFVSTWYNIIFIPRNKTSGTRFQQGVSVVDVQSFSTSRTRSSVIHLKISPPPLHTNCLRAVWISTPVYIC